MSTDAERVLFAPRDLAPLRPDAAQDAETYAEWAGTEQRSRPPLGEGPRSPTVDVVIVVGATEGPVLQATVTSLLAQEDAEWRLWLGTVGPTPPALTATLEGLTSAHGHRIRPSSGPEGADRVTATSAAYEAGEAPAVMVLDPGDRLTPDALSRLGRTLAATGPDEPDMAYGDHDHLDVSGNRTDAVFKPDFSPDLLLSRSYLARPVLMRRRLVDEVGGIVAVPDGDWEHHLMLRAAESAAAVVHVAQVLCHRPGGPEPASAGPGAVHAALARRGERAQVAPGPVPASWSIRRHLGERPLLSVIIPFRDGPRFLRTCVDSATANAGAVDLELVLVDNGSVEPETATLVEQLSARPKTVVVNDRRPFNWAALNNGAVEAASGDLLVFLNNDIEARVPGWAEHLAAQALRPEVGAVGGRLLYPGGRVQHAGVVIGMGGAAGHVLAGLAAEKPGYLAMAVLTRNCSAVTGACLAVRRAVFDELSGFDESLGVDLNDIDFCLRAIGRGYRVVYEPQAELIHYESPSRGTSGSVANITRFVDRWAERLAAGDPYLNPHLTRVDASCALRGPGEDGWWAQWRQGLAAAASAANED